MSVCSKLRARRAKRLAKQRAKLPGRIDRKLAIDTLRRLTNRECSHVWSLRATHTWDCRLCGVTQIDMSETGRTSSSKPNISNIRRDSGKSATLRALVESQVLFPEDAYRDLELRIGPPSKA